MMIAALTLAALLALAVVALLLGLTLWQNRDLRARLRDTGRPPRQVLGAALQLWSPLAVAIVLLVLAARLLSAGVLAVAERATPLDAWCVFEDVPAAAPVPCTGLGRTLPRAALQPAPQAVRARRFVLERYTHALRQLRHDGANAPDRTARLRASAPGAVLGLPPAPQDDPELQRMLGELRALIAAPVPPARNVLDVLRARGEDQIRTRRLRELTAQVTARREALARAAYAGLPPAGQGRLWLQHRLSHRLQAGAMPLEVLARVEAEFASASTPRREAVRLALPAKLAEDASLSVQVLQAEDANAKSRAGLALALELPALCVLEPAPDVEFDCPPLPSPMPTLRLRRLPLATAVPLSIDRWHGQLQRAGFLRLGRIGRAVRAGSRQAEQARRTLAFESRADLGRADCGWSRPRNCADNAARRVVEQALQDALRRSRLPDTVAARGAQAALSFDAALAQAVPDFERRLEAARREARSDAGALLRAHSIWACAGWLLLAWIAVKSFLYVLALVSYRHAGPAVLGFDDAPPVQGTVRMGRRLTLAGDPTQALTTRRQLSNSDNHLRLAPWPGSAPMSRLLRGRYLLYTRGRFLAGAQAQDQAQGRIASAEAGKAIVEWVMQPGEEVVFHWRDFFGASDGLRFRTRVSLRLSTLLLGRIVFRIAQCPADDEGVLLLKADVEEVDPARLHAIAPERLLAWNRQVRFRAHGADTAWGVLVHGYTLVREAGSPGLVLATSVEGGPRFGSLRYLRRLFTAIF